MKPIRTLGGLTVAAALSALVPTAQAVGQTTSPPAPTAPQPKPKPNIDPGINMPPDEVQPNDSGKAAPKPDHQDKSVVPVPAAPSVPQEPGLRPAGG